MELIPPGSVTCLVKGCDTPSTALWESIYFVCRFHLTALAEGASWTVEQSPDHPAPILMGTDLPPEVLNAQVSKRQSNLPIVTLITGRDELEEGRIEVRMSRAEARGLLQLLNVAEGRAPDDYAG